MRRLLLGLYRRALFLLPPSFRHAWGGAMVEEARLALAEASGGWGILRAAAWLLRDGVETWGREWWATLRGGPNAAPVGPGSPIGEGALRGLARDARTALRSFRRAPVFTVVVVVTLSLGIGADTAIFSVVDRVLLRPLPYDAPEELLAVWPGTFHSAADLDRFRVELRTVAALSGYTGTLLTLTEGDEPAELFGAVVTPGHFGVLGVEPALGRRFVEEDGAPGAGPVVILGHRLWVERFGADPSILGRRVALQDDDEAARTVVGVLAAGHEALQGEVDAWIPFVTDPASEGYVDSSSLDLVGRLAEGATVAAAAREVRTLALRMASEDPRRTPPAEARAATVTRLADDLVGNVRPHLLALLAAVGVVLLIACVNVANLLLVRTASRTRELAVRTALGAGRWRLARQLLVESVLLGVAGGAGGLVVAALTRDVLVGAVPGVSSSGGAALDGRVLLFTAGLSVAVGLLFGVAPALRVAARPPGEALGGGRGVRADRRSHRFQHLLVAVEVALTLVAVFSAGLLARSTWRVTAVDPGFETEGALTFRLTAPPSAFPGDEDVLAYFREVVRRVEAVPGVRRAGAVSRLPMDGGFSRISLNPDWYEIPEGEAPPTANHRLVTEGYFEAMGFRLREGRFLGPEDREGPARGLVSAALADRWWPDGAVGRHIRGREGPWLTIVGVVEDVREEGLDRPPFPTVYIPHRDWAWRTMNVVVASDAPAAEILPAVKEAVWSVAAGVAVARPRPLEEVVARSTRDTVLTARLFGLFAVLALALAAVGVYGVVAYTTATRRHELGVRAALGASAARVRAGALLRAAGPLAVGLLAGLAATPVAGRLLGSFVHDLPPLDPVALGASVVILGAVGLVATGVPVWRATAVDAADVLRSE